MQRSGDIAGGHWFAMALSNREIVLDPSILNYGVFHKAAAPVA